MGAITPEILHKDIGSVGLWREAVVTDVDPSVSDSQSIDVERVEAIGVLGERLFDHR